ncbi:putative proline racemase [Mollisia scopiformis]|uniref:trans-L-3-hydroxyproline dehydratase n=1 Tax=Mollisia scopiformis TaxID=149040 RepID=A0A194WXW3_MOLSC|nr:putative proline racemase [Mollisia scopiformis]KUJ12437.1 putative proline racemase [Mollisia scopiformis]
MEPRGHRDMYGALVRKHTELVDEGYADVGVLFMTNAGYPTMCGHAVIALGRLLVDIHDDENFPNRKRFTYKPDEQVMIIQLHAPCGVIPIAVPTTDNGSKSDPERSVSFFSVPSFPTGINVNISIPENLRWPELGQRTEVKADISYGGAFFCILADRELGFGPHLERADRAALENATRNLKSAIITNKELRVLYSHPKSEALSVLYGILVIDSKEQCMMELAIETRGCETGLCFFANSQIDRSPCGGGVAARVALAWQKNGRTEPWTYHSLVSNAFGGVMGVGAFIGFLCRGNISEVTLKDGRTVQAAPVRVSGFAHYTGAHCFVMEKGDTIGEKGFSMYSGNAFVAPTRVKK